MRMKGGNGKCFKICKKSCKCREMCNASIDDVVYLKDEIKKEKEIHESLQKKLMEKLKTKIERQHHSLPESAKESILRIVSNKSIANYYKPKMINSIIQQTRKTGGRRKTKRGGFFEFLNSVKKYETCEKECEKNCDDSCTTICSSINKSMSKELKELEEYNNLKESNSSLERMITYL